MFRSRGAKAGDADAEAGSAPPQPAAFAGQPGLGSSAAGGAGGGGVPERSGACGLLCGPCFPGANDRGCGSFARATRSQQTLLLSVGVLSFWIVGFLYPVSFRAFAYGLVIGSLIFTLGLIFDVLMIGETQRAADAARSFSPALADALEKRQRWRWYAFAINVLGGALTVLGCLLYVQAAGLPLATAQPQAQSPQGAPSPAHVAHHAGFHFALPQLSAAAKEAVWRGNAVFGLSLVAFTAGFALTSLDAIYTLRDVARATGAPEPPKWDDMTAMLAGFGAALALLSAANLLVLLQGHIAGICAGVFGIGGTLLITYVTAWQLRVTWREHVRGAGGFWDPVALEEAALAAAGERGGKPRASRWGRGGGGGGGSEEEGDGVRTPLLGASGAPQPPKRSLLACCFGRGGGAPVEDEPPPKP
jgi:hypothetical protein